MVVGAVKTRYTNRSVCVCVSGVCEDILFITQRTFPALIPAKLTTLYRTPVDSQE